MLIWVKAAISFSVFSGDEHFQDICVLVVTKHLSKLFLYLNHVVLFHFKWKRTMACCKVIRPDVDRNKDKVLRQLAITLVNITVLVLCVMKKEPDPKWFVLKTAWINIWEHNRIFYFAEYRLRWSRTLFNWLRSVKPKAKYFCWH